jgi:hypothetical protein
MGLDLKRTFQAFFFRALKDAAGLGSGISIFAIELRRAFGLGSNSAGSNRFADFHRRSRS